VDLCGIVEHYAIEFQGLQYDPDYPQGYERADLWLRNGPIPVAGVCNLVVGFLESLAGDFTGPLCAMPNGAIAFGANHSKVTFSNGIESMKTETQASDVSALVAFPDGVRVGVGAHCGLVAVWDTLHQTFDPMPKLSQGSVRSLVVLTDGKLAVGSSGQDVMVWDVDTKRCVWDWQSLSPSYATVFPMVALPDAMFASGSMDSMVRIWDINLGTVKLLRGHRRAVNALALIPGGSLVSASADTTVLVWDIARGTCVRQLTGHSMPVRSLVVLDRDRLAAGSMAHNVCIWHIPTGECIHHLWGHGGSVRAMAILFDGTLACAAGGVVIVWDLDSGECLHVLRGHPGTEISHLAVLPNGQLVSGGLDYNLRFWI
jgi:WD40 repeat protein